jgi:hypothetical protein
MKINKKNINFKKILDKAIVGQQIISKKNTMMKLIIGYKEYICPFLIDKGDIITWAITKGNGHKDLIKIY